MTASPEQFKASIEAITDDGDDEGDPERIHKEMDRLLVGLLRDLGYGEAMDIYDHQYKWYA